jgi:hypothetical protein
MLGAAEAGPADAGAWEAALDGAGLEPLLEHAAATRIDASARATIRGVLEMGTRLDLLIARVTPDGSRPGVAGVRSFRVASRGSTVRLNVP